MQGSSRAKFLRLEQVTLQDELDCNLVHFSVISTPLWWIEASRTKQGGRISHLMNSRV